MRLRDKVTALALALDVDIGEHIDGVLRMKERLPDWRICPCNKSDERFYCGSRQCEKDIKEYGYCHCRLFKRKEVIMDVRYYSRDLE